MKYSLFDSSPIRVACLLCRESSFTSETQSTPCLPLHSVRLMWFKSDIFVFCVCVHVRKKKKKKFCALIRKRACKQMSRNLDFAELKAQTAELKALGKSTFPSQKKNGQTEKKTDRDSHGLCLCVWFSFGSGCLCSFCIPIRMLSSVAAQRIWMAQAQGNGNTGDADWQDVF